MRNVAQAMKALFNQSETVTCHDCGADLTHERNLPRVIRRGCPKCGSKKLDFKIENQETQEKLVGVVPHVG